MPEPAGSQGGGATSAPGSRKSSVSGGPARGRRCGPPAAARSARLSSFAACLSLSNTLLAWDIFRTDLTCRRKLYLLAFYIAYHASQAPLN